MTDRPHIDIDPGVQGGEPCIAGTRLPAFQMAREWQAGAGTWEEMQRQYPTLTREGLLIACWWQFMSGGITDTSQWRGWARKNRYAFAEGHLADVPLPPQKASEELA